MLMVCIYLGVMAEIYVMWQKMIAQPDAEEAARKSKKEQKRAAKKNK